MWGERTPAFLPLRTLFPRSRCPQSVCGQVSETTCLYWLPAARSGREFRPLESLVEADLSAQRAQAEAETRLSRPHVDTRRTLDPQAPPCEGAEAAVRLSAPGAVQRRNRLSRSRDFDT